MEVFTESYDTLEKNWGEIAPGNVTDVLNIAFNQTLSECSLKALRDKIMLLKNCKIAKA